MLTNILRKKSTLGGIKWKIRIAKRFLKHKWQRINGFNPYNVKPNGMCPVQAEGILKDGEWYYFRARGSRIAFVICESEEDYTGMLDHPPFLFEREMYYGMHDYQAGWITHEDAVRLITVWLNEYYTHQQTLQIK